MRNPTHRPDFLNKAQKRLFLAYRRLGSWQRLADAKKVFVLDLYNFVMLNKEPENYHTRIALGLYPWSSKKINHHLAHDNIQDMPLAILAMALQFREEMK